MTHAGDIDLPFDRARVDYDTVGEGGYVVGEDPDVFVVEGPH